MRYRIRLSYNGSAFSGWQIQPNAPSVQECLQRALKTLLNESITITGAGRTDTKVNAINYIAHFDAESSHDIDMDFLRYKLNAILPAEIAVHEVSVVRDDFHSRFDATSREYKYFIHRKKDPFMSDRSYLFTLPLDLEAMNRGAALLLGEHDFSCFEKVGGNNKTSVCNITDARWETWTPDHVRMMGYPCIDGDYIVFTVRADRFLRNMVRAIVGSMIEIGRGKRSPEWIGELVDHGTRSDAGQSVPGHALFLTECAYPENDGKEDKKSSEMADSL